MCLTHEFPSLQDAHDRCPGDEFYVYKIVRKSGNRLVSPHFSHKEWKPGEMIASGRNRNNGDHSGMFCFLVCPEPGSVVSLTRNASGWSHKGGGDRILKLKARKEDIVWGGEDSWNGKKGTCLVMRRVELAQEDYEDALDDNQHDKRVEKVLIEAKETIKKGQKSRATKKKAATKTAKKAKTRAKKTQAENLSVADLKARCQELKITGYSGKNKAQLQELIDAKLKENEKAKKTADRAKKKATKKTTKTVKKKATATKKSAKKTASAAKKRAKKKSSQSKWTGKTVGELKAACKAAKIKGYSSMTKDELIRALDRK